MAKSNGRTCVICGKKYSFCYMCGDRQFEWKFTSCSPRCFEVSKILNRSFYGQIDTADAIEALELAGYQEIETFTDSASCQIEKLKADLKKQKRRVKHAEDQENGESTPETPTAE